VNFSIELLLLVLEMVWSSERVSTMLYHKFLFADNGSILKLIAGWRYNGQEKSFWLSLMMFDWVLHFWKHQKSILYKSRTGALFVCCDHQ
jgi:hypothetical protein